MFNILKQDERHILTATDIQSQFDSAIPDVKFNLSFPAISSDLISLGSTKDGTNTEGFLRYLDLLAVSLEEANYTEVVEVFGKMHPWTEILKSINDFGRPGLHVRQKKKNKAQIYVNIIRPPVFLIEKDVRKIRLWAVNILNGNLEQWTISEDSQGTKRVESEIVEKWFTITLD